MPLRTVAYSSDLHLPARVYLDTNVLLYARDRDSARYRQASSCLGELIRQGCQLHVSQLTFDELWWTLFRQSYRLETGEELTARTFRENRSVWQHSWPRIRSISEELLQWGRLSILEVSSTVLVRETIRIIDTNPLAPRDAFHLAIAVTNHVPGFVTADRDYEEVILPDADDLVVVRV